MTRMSARTTFVRCVLALIAQTLVWWLAAVKAGFSDPFAAAVLGALAINLFFNFPFVSMFAGVVNEQRNLLKATDVIGKAATVIVIASPLELVPILIAASYGDPEVIGGTLFIVSLMPMFWQGMVTIVRGVRILSR